MDFKDQTVVVTGATRGIWRQLAEDLAARGASLILTGTKPDEVARLNQRYKTAERERRYHAVDFGNRDSLDAFLDALARHERIDVCINNAGVNRLDSIDQVTDDDWDMVAEVNLRAPMAITRAVAPIMRRHGYGRIVNIASIWAHVGRASRASYASMKSGLRGLTVASAIDLAPDILVNAVSPGFTVTEMVQQNYSDDERRALENLIPLGRMATPQEISPVVLVSREPSQHIRHGPDTARRRRVHLPLMPSAPRPKPLRGEARVETLERPLTSF